VEQRAEEQMEQRAERQTATGAPMIGLSDAEAQRRRAAGMGNSAPPPSTRTYGQILRENLFTFINMVLFGLGIALVVLHRPTDAAISVGVIMLNIIVSIVQEIRAKRTLDRIALLTRPTASVVRDGQEREVAPEELVVGDVIAIGPGDQIVVDGRVIDDGRAAVSAGVGTAAPHMQVDESLLTGESNLIAKHEGDPVYSGSFCVTGTARYVAERVGAESLAHKLTADARAFRRVLTPLQRQINVVIRAMLLVVVYIEILLVANSVLNRVSLVESVQQSVIIAGLVPNGLLLSIALAYAIGAVRILRFGALVQQANAIESLSCVDVLCLDKTGTLTANRLLLDDVAPIETSEAQLRRTLGAMAASATGGNKTSEAIAAAFPADAHPLVAEVPFSSARKWSAVAFDDRRMPPSGTGDRSGSNTESNGNSGGDDAHLTGVYALGAPEMLAPYLGPDAAPGTPTGRALAARIQDWTTRGLRVLLVAHFPDPARLADEGDASRLPDGLRALGLVSLRDELRPEARETLAAFVAAGVRPKIISGDDARTVAALARQAGLTGMGKDGEGDGGDLRTVTGAELARMEKAEFEAAATSATIFGRVTPQQKARLVEALRRRGHYVAMIGDGVNDVLSLKKAHLGIAMQSGSQAARGVADLVLMNDSFEALVPAVAAGQRIVNGMQDILKIFLARITTIALVVMSAWLIGIFPLELRNSSLVTLLTVGIPSILLALWARPGRAVPGGLMRQLIRFVVPAAMTSTLLSLLLFYGRMVLPVLERTSGRPRLPAGELASVVAANLQVAQTMLTAFLVVCGVVLLLFVDPPARWWAVANPLVADRRPALLALGLLTLFTVILLVPLLRNFFSLAALSAGEVGVVALCGLLWLVTVRTIWRLQLMERFLGMPLPPPRTRKPPITSRAP
jgi:cation-transporting ATPase E